MSDLAWNDVLDGIRDGRYITAHVLFHIFLVLWISYGGFLSCRSIIRSVVILNRHYETGSIRLPDDNTTLQSDKAASTTYTTAGTTTITTMTPQTESAIDGGAGFIGAFATLGLTFAGAILMNWIRTGGQMWKGDAGAYLKDYEYEGMLSLSACFVLWTMVIVRLVLATWVMRVTR